MALITSSALLSLQPNVYTVGELPWKVCPEPESNAPPFVAINNERLNP